MPKIDQACGGPLNPWNYEATPSRKYVAVGIAAASAIAASVAALAILASAGVNLHVFNALNVLTTQGGSALLAGSILVEAIAAAWLCSKTWPKPNHEEDPIEPTLPSQPVIPQDQTPADFETSATPSPSIEEPYNPLEELKTRRLALFAPLPPQEEPKSYGIMNLIQASRKLEITYSENVRAGSKAIQLKRKYTAFIAETRSLAEGLVRGEVQTGWENKPVTFEETLLHPVQIDMVLEFARQQVESFNALVQEEPEENKARVELIDVNTFMQEEPFEQIRKERDAWRQLLEIEGAPVLEEDHLAVLENLQAPQYLKSQFQALLQKIAEKPTSNVENASRLFNKLGGDFEIKLPTPQSLVKAFTNQLTKDIQNLFQYQSENDPTPPLERTHIGHIREYIHAEERRFQETSGIEIDVYQTFKEDIEKLEEAWATIDTLKNPDLGILDKTQILSEFVLGLPHADDPIWKKYPVIKDRMGEKLTFLSLTYYSNYQFTFPLSEEDQILFTQIESAYGELFNRFGCEVPTRPEASMNCENDALLAQMIQMDLDSQ